MSDPKSREHSGSGNLAILTKVDKLRELIGNRVALPQLVVVGDQSSGKSSVLENLTGFAFPRAAELCTRYATQITCRREDAESTTVTIMPNPDAAPEQQARVKEFHRTFTGLDSETLAQVFKEANEAMGIRPGGDAAKTENAMSLPAFSEHILRIEKCGPNEEHFTVIDVPGIFRTETEGLTIESDIALVMNMVKNYMKDPRTIILAIMPSNVDPATQEILKLAKQADPKMTRTMAVLTKPDLAIERTTQQIAIDHVLGKRSDLTLGYYIVKNRGPDDANKTLEEGQMDERKFFAKSPWSKLQHTGRAGVESLKRRVRELLIDLIKKEFPQLKHEVSQELNSLKGLLSDMGPSRNGPETQRAYLVAVFGQMRPFEFPDSVRAYAQPKLHRRPGSAPEQQGNAPRVDAHHYPELDEIFDPIEEPFLQKGDTTSILEYIEDVYMSSRGPELGTFAGSLLKTLFQEQSKRWDSITTTHMTRVITHVHHFIHEALRDSCTDPKVFDELWNAYLLDELQKAYRGALEQAKRFLSVERNSVPITLNHYFSSNLQQAQGKRLVEAMEKLGIKETSQDEDDEEAPPDDGDVIRIKKSDLQNLAVDKANATHVREYMHDVLYSYYKVAQKRFVDIICQHAVNHYLLSGEDSPLKKFNTQMVLGLNEEQLDMIAGEDAHVRQRREKLGRDIANFDAALKVLKGSG